MRMRKIFVMLVMAAAGAATLAFAAPTVEDQIKARQSAYTYMGWNMARIKAQAVDGEVTFNAAQVQAAANAIAAIAASNMSSMYSPDTVEGSGWKPTRLKREFFDELDKVGEIAGRFIEETARLAEVAETGDQAAIARQFEATASACGSCHRNYRASE